MQTKEEGEISDRAASRCSKARGQRRVKATEKIEENLQDPLCHETTEPAETKKGEAGAKVAHLATDCTAVQGSEQPSGHNLLLRG